MHYHPFVACLQAMTWWEPKSALCDWRVSGMPHSESKQLLGVVPEDLRHASVLLLVRAGRVEPKVILTRRSRTLRTHANLWSLPGGKADANDADALDTAIRETSEELGILPNTISVLGRLPDHILVESRYRLAVFLGLLEDSVVLNPRYEEVAEVIELPLSVLLEPRYRISRLRTLGSLEFLVEDIVYNQVHIWGSTAGVLVTLSRLLFGKHPDEKVEKLAKYNSLTKLPT